MNCLLAVAPYIGGNLEIQGRHESLALGYLAICLRDLGHNVDILNAPMKGCCQDDILEQVSKEDYQLIGFSLSDPGLVESTIKTIKDIKAAGYKDHVCIGGYTATFNYEKILELCPEIDSVVLYDGEDTICELAESINSGSNWRYIPGIAYAEQGNVITTPLRQNRANLDTFKFPARDGLPYILKNNPNIKVPVLGSRGCHFNCKFCSVRAFYEYEGKSTWRRRSVANLVDEIEKLVADYGVEDFVLIDDLFLDSSSKAVGYAEQFAHEIVKRQIPILFTISATIDAIKQDTIELLRDAGLSQVYMGVESASLEILRYLNKWFKPEQITKTIEVLRNAKLDILTSYINFTPITTTLHIKENLDFFCNLNIDLVPGMLNRYQAYPGSPLFAELKAANRLKGDFPFYDYIGDEKVDHVYDICKNAFRPYLILSKEIRRISYSIAKNIAKSRRIILDKSNKIKMVDESEKLTLFKNFRSEINRNISSHIKVILDFVENKGYKPEDNLILTQKLAPEIKLNCQEWSKTLKYIEAFCF